MRGPLHTCRSRLLPLLLCTLTAAWLPGCGDSPSSGPEADNDLARAAVAWHAEQVHAMYVATRSAAGEMKQALETLATRPSEESLAAAREAWLEARKVYAPTEAFRFREGPIDHSRDGVEGLLNAWPMDEAYVDYVAGQPTAGIIQNKGLAPTITAELLESLNEKDGEENIATGWHTIEFLLWGQDQSLEGPGTRKATDFLQGEGGHPHAARRVTYLRVVTDLLLKHLDKMVDAWAPNKDDNHRHGFTTTLKPQEGLRRMLTGIGTLVVDELRGERIFVAYDTQDPENEQSCFSDTTHFDHQGNLAGVRHIWYGTFLGEDGPGFDEMLKAADPELNKVVDAAFARATDSMAKLPVPFDAAIQAADDSAERKQIMTIVNDLDALGEALAKAGVALDLEVNFEGAGSEEGS